jgi:RNA recognition motif-containing protein
MQQNQRQNAPFPGQQPNPQMFNQPMMMPNPQQMMFMQQQQMMSQFPNQPQMMMPAHMQQQLLMAKGPRDMTSRPTFENEKTLYIGNLAENTFENDLYKFFESKGHKVSNCKVVIDGTTMQHRHFGYLNFKTEEDALSCLEACKNMEINGRQITLSRKKDGFDLDTQANLHVKNLPDNLTQNQLHDLF